MRGLAKEQRRREGTEALTVRGGAPARTPAVAQLRYAAIVPESVDREQINEAGAFNYVLPRRRNTQFSQDKGRRQCFRHLDLFYTDTVK